MGIVQYNTNKVSNGHKYLHNHHTYTRYIKQVEERQNTKT
jgi:hypothetical protein